MKNKILLGIMAFVMGLFAVSCSDDDYAISSKALLDENSVVTGSADVTPTTATLKGTVDGLQNQAATSYVTGFYYGTASDKLDQNVTANSASAFSAQIVGKTGEQYYYQAYVTLQGRLTYKGEVKSLILTEATTTTGEASDITANTAKLSGVAAKYADAQDAKMGIVISSVDDDEAVRAGVRIEGQTGDNFDISVYGLLPNTTYYYASYVDLGDGNNVIFGEKKSFTTPAQTFDVDNDFVDLGLSTKWSRFNLGTTSESELGGLFGFGDLAGFNTSTKIDDYAGADVYKSVKDVVYQAYNGKATLPTIDEYEELFSICNVEWTSITTVDGTNVNGYKCTGPNGNSIFLPAAGSRTGAQISGVGETGYYLSGSVNADDKQYDQSYMFNSTGCARATTPVYQALSVRAVSVAKNVPFDKTLLFNKKWELDINDKMECKTFTCPLYFYKGNACWNSVTNNEPLIDGAVDWAPGSPNDVLGWGLSTDPADNEGYILFNEDGTVEVRHGGEATTPETGTYEIDEEAKTITLHDVTAMRPGMYNEEQVPEPTKIRILSLTDKAVQMALTRNDGAQLSFNFIPEILKYGFKAKLTCYGGDAADAWNAAIVDVPGTAVGTYTVTFNAETPRTEGMVYCLDIEGLAKTYPNAFVKIDEIKADGKDLPFDANKFYYGDIEGKGTFRVEMANIWGKGNQDWNSLKDSPFREGGGHVEHETNLAFNSTFEVTFTIVSTDAVKDGILSFNASQAAVSLEPVADWIMNGSWGKEFPAAVKVKYEDYQYKIDESETINFTISRESDCGVNDVSNGAVNYLDISGIRKYFPGFALDLSGISVDGKAINYAADNILSGDIEGKGNFRIEIHNIWGNTGNNPAFETSSVSGNNVVPALGFKTNLTYSVKVKNANLFAVPQTWH